MAREDDVVDRAGSLEKEGKSDDDELPCRLEMSFHGLEWFVYNRSDAYDSILAGFGHIPRNEENDSQYENQYRSKTEKQPASMSSSVPVSTEMSSASKDGEGPQNIRLRNSAMSSKNLPTRNDTPASSFSNAPSNAQCQSGPIFKILELLPIGVKCQKAAMILGNENTQTVLTLAADRAVGEIDADVASSPLDVYKQIFSFEFDHPVMRMRPNPDFKHPQLAGDNKLDMAKEDKRKQSRHKFRSWFRHQLRGAYHSLKNFVPYYLQNSVESLNPNPQHRDDWWRKRAFGEDHWIGLTRYIDEEDWDEHEGWTSVEYGRFSTLLDCPSMQFTYIWDIAGTVPFEIPEPESSVYRIPKDINGADPPEWSASLTIRGGMINYGPWADRERARIQNVLFPNFYRDSEVAGPLSPGSQRVSTVFRLLVDVEEGTTFRIPTREPSKDWLWKGRAEAVRGASKANTTKDKKRSRGKDTEGSHGPNVRPFGWLELHVSANSTINYTMAMAATKDGFYSRIELDLQDTSVSTSVNHQDMWKAGRQIVSCDLSTPVGWNALRMWTFEVDSESIDLFLLRDHIHLLNDLAADWTSGPSPDFYTFVPFQYNFSLLFRNFRLFLNVNDTNIIDDPVDLNDNAFLIIKGNTVTLQASYPATNYRPTKASVPFNLVLQDGSIDLSTPVWNTQHTFMSNPCVATMGALTIEGNYTYYFETLPSLNDILTLNVGLILPKLTLYGFLIRYFLLVKDNYFGENQHFKTLEEYQKMVAESIGDDASDRGANFGSSRPRAFANPEKDRTAVNPHRKTNDMDIIFEMHGHMPSILVPSNIYDRNECLKFSSCSFDTDMRFTNYYMDFQTTVSPLVFVVDTLIDDGSYVSTEPQLFIDGLMVYGHRLFGLPPAEPTYVCNWDFDVGEIAGQCSPTFLQSAVASFRFLGLSINDEENALPPLRPVMTCDVTFLRLKVKAVNIWIIPEEIAILLSLGEVSLDFNDWVGSKFSQRMNLSIPNVIFTAVDRKSAENLTDSAQQNPFTYAHFETVINIRMLERNADFYRKRQLQQEHIRVNDRRSGRANWLLDMDMDEDIRPVAATASIPPSMTLPSMPEPIQTTFHTQSPIYFDSASSIHHKFPNDRKATLESSWHNPSIRYRNRSPAHLSPPRVRSTSPASQTRQNSTAGKINPKRTPWTMPDFYYYGIVPDMINVPPLPEHIETARPRSWYPEDDSDVFFDQEYENTSHVYFICDFTPGLRGFFSPETIFAMTSFLDGFQPYFPISIIDKLQADVVSDILFHEQSASSPKKVSNFCLKLPATHLRLINSSVTLSESTATYRDQYDLELAYLTAYFRGRTVRRAHSIEPENHGFAFHITASSAALSGTSETVDIMDQSGVFHVNIEDVLCWSAISEVEHTTLQFQDFQLITSSKSIGDLALLVERTTKLAESSIVPFQQISVRQSNRLHFLTYFLSQQGIETADPVFLTRPSNVLRAAREHFRAHDSWKILSRLRHIYNTLPASVKNGLRSQLWHNSFRVPQDARESVLSTFDRWRSWDLSLAQRSHVMKVIWGDAGQGQNEPTNYVAPQIFSFFFRRMRLSLDPGPKENSLFVHDFSTSVCLNADVQNDIAEGMSISSITIHTSCSDVSLKLKWEICELIEGLIKNIPQIVAQSEEPLKSEQPPEPKRNNQRIHIVFIADQGSMILDAINIRAVLGGNRLKGSLIHRISLDDSIESISCILAGESTEVKLDSRSQALMVWRFLAPNFYLSHVLQFDNSHDHSWKFAAASESLRYDLEEDLLGIIRVIDRLIADELKYIVDLASAVQASSPPKTSTDLPHDRQVSSHKFSVATFLHEYRLCFAILPSLSYVIAGQVVRLSIAPAASSKLEVDFDMKENSHIFQSREKVHQTVFSVISIPPINGRVLVDPTPNRTTLDMDITIELVVIDAGAIRNLLSVINGPEISHLVSDFSHDVDIIGQNLRGVLPGPLSPKTSPPNQAGDLVYKALLTMAGVDIQLRSSGYRCADYVAEMKFSSGAIQAHAENSAAGGLIYEFPEFHIQLFCVSLDLAKVVRNQRLPCGHVEWDLEVIGSSKHNEKGSLVQSYHLISNGFQLDLIAETATLAVDFAAYLQERFKAFELSPEFKNLGRLRGLSLSDTARKKADRVPEILTSDEPQAEGLFSSLFFVELNKIQLCWIVSTESNHLKSGVTPENLVYSIQSVKLETRRQNAARLHITAMQLQMVPMFEDKMKRTLNSILLPELVFNATYLSKNNNQLVFQVAGKAIEIRVTSESIIPASIIRDSIASASAKIREANSLWSPASGTTRPKKKEQQPTSSRKKLGSLIIDADVAGAVVTLQGRQAQELSNVIHPITRQYWDKSEGKYGQFVRQNSATTATLRSPGMGVKIRFEDNGINDPILNAEIQITASSNTIHPTVVPLIVQIVKSIQEVVSKPEAVPADDKKTTPDSTLGKGIVGNDPTTILGHCKLNGGLQIHRQEFTLSCQPVARVSATAYFDSSYITLNSVSEDEKRFYALLLKFSNLSIAVKHMYSNEPTASLALHSLVVSLMNSKYVSSRNGISAILKLNPSRAQINIRQVQDFLLFQEIWAPPEGFTKQPPSKPTSEDQSSSVQRYHHVAATNAFPWNAVISIVRFDIGVDFGQTLGKSDIAIKNLWVSSKKTSDSMQDLCLGIEGVEAESIGRASGFLALHGVNVRTTIKWPDKNAETDKTPLIQASASFNMLKSDLSFEYQPFFVADIADFNFLMYNARNPEACQDHLISVLEGNRLQVFCTALTASQFSGLLQAIRRLIAEKQSARETSLKEIERFVRRKSTASLECTASHVSACPGEKKFLDRTKMPIFLQTDVIVKLHTIRVGIFPSTFHDNQVFKLCAFDSETRFSVSPTDGKIHDGLRLTLGQVQVELSSISHPTPEVGKLSIEEVAARAGEAYGGTILKVPRAVVSMETWQVPGSNHIEYIFKSAFEGKVDVGWNYSRISFIRNMWTTHTRALASRLGKPLPEPAVHFTRNEGPPEGQPSDGQEKITAVVHVPQSKYTYEALEPPVIETPQLRDMGEATPPLEWIGLNIDRLPNVTHQIIIVTLMEIASDVEDAYNKILGSSP